MDAEKNEKVRLYIGLTFMILFFVFSIYWIFKSPSESETNINVNQAEKILDSNQDIDDKPLKRIEESEQDLASLILSNTNNIEVAVNANVSEETNREVTSNTPPTKIENPNKSPDTPTTTVDRPNDNGCSSADRILGTEGCSPQPTTTPNGGVNLVSHTNTTKSKNSIDTQKSGVAPIVQEPELRTAATPRHDLLKWKELASEEISVTQGRQTVYEDRVIRAGCRVMAVLEDGMIVTSGGEPHDFTVNVRGALDGCTLPQTDGIRLVGTAKMDNQGKYVIATISTCSDRNPKRKSVSCKGARVKSLTGSDLLEGDLYDNTGWGIFFESLAAVAMTPAIAKLTETASTAKTIFQSSMSQSIADTMTKQLAKISDKIAGVFDGKEIRTPENAVVIILFKDDVIL